jgi:predicted dehydrogenase
MIQTVGVIGLGSIGLRHRRNLKSLLGKVTVVGMSASARQVDGEIPFCDRLAKSLDEISDLDPGLVIVASPAPLHAEHAVHFLKRRVPVIVEKPVAASVEEAEKILDAVNESGTAAAVGYCLRHSPGMQAVSSAIASGTLGEIYNVDVSVGQFLPTWRPGKDYRHTVSASRALGGGVLNELSHEFDYLFALFGDLEVEYSSRVSELK